MTETYQFRPFTAADLPLMATWLERPHMAEWWGDAREQLALIGEDLGHPDMDQYLVLLDGRPFGYLQSYAMPLAFGCFGEQPDGARGIDQSIGEPDMVDRGHGSAFVRQFVDQSFARGVPRIVTDPDPANARAIRCYEKAGFRRDRLVDTPGGPALLMVRDP